MTKKTGIDNITVIISPSDLRINKLVVDNNTQSDWVAELYHNIEMAFKPFKKMD